MARVDYDKRSEFYDRGRVLSGLIDTAGETRHAFAVAPPGTVRRPVRMARQRKVLPADLEATADLIAETCGPFVHLDWDQRAGTLDWTVKETLVHMGSSCTFYALHLAGGTDYALPVTLASVGEAPNAALLDVIRSSACVLATVARSLPPSQCAFHDAGKADVEGFLAMGCSELLVHLSDVAAGLDINAALPAECCRAVLDRLFPWAPADLAPAESLLWVNGRDLPTRPASRPPIPWHCEPID